MDMDIDDTSKRKDEEKKTKQIVVILAGSGKSTFCEHVMGSSARSWVLICQDTINNGKAGSKVQCLMTAASVLKEGKSVFIDRCNLEREQRTDFVKFGGPQVDVHSVVLDLPAKLGYLGQLNGLGMKGVCKVEKLQQWNRMLQKKELPKLSEGFSRITLCQNESDVQAALEIYNRLGPFDTIPHGSFGQKNPNAKVQLGINKFLKKVEVPSNVGSSASSTQDSVTLQIAEVKNHRREGREYALSSSDTAGEEIKGTENPLPGSVSQNVSSSDVPTLAFPSISHKISNSIMRRPLT